MVINDLTDYPRCPFDGTAVGLRSIGMVASPTLTPAKRSDAHETPLQAIRRTS